MFTYDQIKWFDDYVKAELAIKKNAIASHNIEMLINYLTEFQYKKVMERIIEDDYKTVSKRKHISPITLLSLLGYSLIYKNDKLYIDI